ncbi:hypothetical protein BW727_101245 [Jeotgalibaca dankookensis]|uniref:DUF3784 domain-containing protein n=1 Tax=Jeotgalibaca dankookensis TaxID=708126 RepID=A0A1S6IPY4_9LACT|nr:DUF3784 domain-containing protein [Jeotgalibaca dankookensis]AQS53612.1 hypothetical protein BW727_101245 [Jeotgalibaca dankookensis]
MNIESLVIGIIVVVLSYLVGIKKFTWLLAGYNERRVIDKDKLSKLVGITYFILGVILILNGFFSLKTLEYLAIIGVIIVLLEVFYVNFKLVR